jgi:endonuclease YncB( thermonuclease family)
VTNPSPSGDGGATFLVSRVIDGDTVVLDDGRHVRLAQVDAPETYQCFGSQSTQALRELVDGKPVMLRRPDDAPKTDRYGRTLAELLVDGVSADEELIRLGAAEWYEQYAHEDADLAQRLQAAEADAAANRRGLWSTCAVGVAPPPVTVPTTTTTPAPRSLYGGGGTASEASSSSCYPGYPDDCIPPGPPDLDCGSAEIRRRVHVDHAYGDPHHFDADKDGWGCESYG